MFCYWMRHFVNCWQYDSNHTSSIVIQRNETFGWGSFDFFVLLGSVSVIRPLLLSCRVSCTRRLEYFNISSLSDDNSCSTFNSLPSQPVSTNRNKRAEKTYIGSIGMSKQTYGLWGWRRSLFLIGILKKSSLTAKFGTLVFSYVYVHC